MLIVKRWPRTRGLSTRVKTRHRDCSVARRSWARQSSGALLCRIPKSGDSGYGFRL